MSTDIRFNKKKVNHFQGTTEELFGSNRGTQSFQRWKIKFPTLEKKISSLGNLFFQGWKVFGKPTCSAKSAVAAVSLATRSNLSDDYLVTPTWGAKIGWVEAKGDC